VHVTLKLKPGLPSLRHRPPHSVIVAAMAALLERVDFRLVHYSVQNNHVHLLCEAIDRSALSRGIQAFAIRVAKNLNSLWHRFGKLFADRYHDRILRGPREVHAALGYVLNNAAKHGALSSRERGDPFSSERWFRGSRSAQGETPPSPLSAAKTWLLSIGWQLCGPIDLAGAPW
jgi:REP element-mobilizing transposase RayT